MFWAVWWLMVPAFKDTDDMSSYLGKLLYAVNVTRYYYQNITNTSDGLGSPTYAAQ